MSQPVRIIGRKPPIELDREIPTPAGKLSFQPEMSIRREWGFATLPVLAEVEGVRAEVSFHLGGSNEDDLPTSLRVVFSGGVERWLVARGEPIEHEGRKVAWSCSAELDLATAMPNSPECWLSEFEAPQERRVAGIMARTVKDPALAARMAQAVANVLGRWAKEDRGYAARVYGAMMRAAQDDVEGMAERARLDFVAAQERRDRVARLARRGETAAKVDAGAWKPPTFEEIPERPIVELRGFGDGDVVDAMNLDEIVVVAPVSLHVETMSDEHTWMGVYLADGRRLAVNFRIEGGKLLVGAEIDDDGL